MSESRGVQTFLAGMTATALLVLAGREFIPPTQPIDQHRGSDGVVSSEARYEGSNQFVLDDYQLGDSPLTGIFEFDMYGHPDTHDVTTLDGLMYFADPAPSTGPVTTVFDDLPDNIRQQSLEERAITVTTERISNRQQVNVLPGALYSLGVEDYNDIGTGAYDEGRETFEEYHTPVMYIERHGNDNHVVLVSTRNFGQSMLDAYDDRHDIGLDEFFTTSDGTVMVTTERGDFVSEDSQYRAWTARQFDGDCQPGTASSNCLYKSNQNRPHKDGQMDLRYEGHTQFIVVTTIEWLGSDTQATTSGQRDIEMQPVLVTSAESAVAVGQQYSAGHPATGVLVTERLDTLIHDGGQPFSGNQLLDLPVYTLD